MPSYTTPTIITDTSDIECDFIHGDVDEMAERVESWQIPGVDGHGGQMTGQGGGRFDFRCVIVSTYSECRLWRASMKALAGQMVSVVDDWLEQWDNLIVEKVLFVSRKPMASINATIDIRTRMEMRIQGIQQVPSES